MPFIETGDIQTFYESTGRGPPIVLVHASTLDHHSWRKQIADLGGGHRVVVYDLRGHGRTAGPPRRRYSVETLSDDLRAVVTCLGLDRPIICGISMGGMVAHMYAARHPQELRALVLAGTPTAPLLSFSERLQRAWLPRAVTAVARISGYEVLRKRMAGMQRKVHGHAAVGSFESADLPRMHTRDFVHAIRCFATFHRTKVDLSAIQVPTLVMYGNREPRFLLRHADQFRTKLSGSQVVTIAGAGHASNMDQPELFSAAVLRFLASIDVAPTESGRPGAAA